MTWVRCLFLVSVASFCLNAHARYNPKAHDLRCKDITKGAKEAVAYSLVGAWEPYANHKCFEKEKFDYFRPKLGKPEGDIIDTSKRIPFRRGRDSYQIESVQRDGRDFLISVKFTIDKKMISTKYRYVPDPEYTGRTGICGFVTNFNHKIIREDCIRQKGSRVRR